MAGQWCGHVGGLGLAQVVGPALGVLGPPETDDWRPGRRRRPDRVERHVLGLGVRIAVGGISHQSEKVGLTQR